MAEEQLTIKKNLKNSKIILMLTLSHKKKDILFYTICIKIPISTAAHIFYGTMYSVSSIYCIANESYSSKTSSNFNSKSDPTCSTVISASIPDIFKTSCSTLSDAFTMVSSLPRL